MINPELIKGESVALPEMLDAREQRQFIQQQLISEYKLPLISFTLNIAGPVKVFPLSIQTYNEGILRIKQQLAAQNLVVEHFKEIKEKTGYEAFFVINAKPELLKQITNSIENETGLGRLFDMDVIQANGQKLSRTDQSESGRKCLICGGDVFVCSRSRTHAVSEIFARTCEIMAAAFDIGYMS